MPNAQECRYTKGHEWAYLEGDTITVGVTDFAQKELGDIVYVDLSGAGTSVGGGEELGSIESVKAVAEVYAPVAGEVVAVNPDLEANPEKVNEEPLGAGWLIQIKVANPSDLDSLMSLDDYTKFLESEDH